MENISRRKFLKTSTAVAGGLVILPSMSRCAGNAPSDKVNVAVVGVGGRGGASWGVAKAEGDNVVALCDVSQSAAEKAFKTFPEARRFKDFRVMLDKMHKDIDAVMVCTPDHVHFPAAMAAMEMKKHVLVEKPLAHNVWQLRTLVKAADYYKVTTQLANQGHTTNGIRQIKEWYQAGVLGEVKEVLAWFGGPGQPVKQGGYYLKPDSFPVKEEPVPEWLDWDLWLGPSRQRPYSHYYQPRFWRGWYEMGNGELGDWACHMFDGPFWALDLDIPIFADSLHKSENTYYEYVPDESILQIHFAAKKSKPAVDFYWYEGGPLPEFREEWNVGDIPGVGVIMVGSKKSLILRGGRPNHPRLLVSDEEWEEFKKNMPAQTIPRVPEDNPQKEWLDAIKGKGPKPGSSFEYGARLTEMALLGVMSQRLGTKIEYDAANMKVTNHPDYDKYIKEPVREGWSYGEKLWRK